MRIGRYLYGLATAAAGLLDLMWGEFEAAHQPIGALGDHVPGLKLLAYIAAIWMMAGGIAILNRRTARSGAIATALIYLVFATFWLPRFYTAPHVLGLHLNVFVGVLAGVFTQLVAVVGGLIIWVSLASSSSASLKTSLVVTSWIFGGGAIAFGLSHLTAVQDVSEMVPTWMPLGRTFWVMLTGAAFLFAGLAILSGVLKGVAAHLLAVMLLAFEIALVPAVFADPHDHVVWGANAYNLAAAGAAWIFASWTKQRHRVDDPVCAEPL